MNHIWTISIEDYLIIMEEAIILGTERGKVKGDNLEQEFFEIAEKKGLLHKIKNLGTTEMDKDLFMGNLREQGIRIFSPEEEERRKKIKEEE